MNIKAQIAHHVAMSAPQSEAGGQVNDIAAATATAAVAIAEQRPLKKPNLATTLAKDQQLQASGVDEQKLDILILEKYIENHFFVCCFAVLVLFHLLPHKHGSTSIAFIRAASWHHSWPIEE